MLSCADDRKTICLPDSDLCKCNQSKTRALNLTFKACRLRQPRTRPLMISAAKAAYSAESDKFQIEIAQVMVTQKQWFFEAENKSYGYTSYILTYTFHNIS